MAAVWVTAPGARLSFEKLLGPDILLFASF